jgi:hypothetical protein
VQGHDRAAHHVADQQSDNGPEGIGTKNNGECPSTMAVIWALAPNQSVNCPRGWPWRSPGGIISIERASTALLAAAMANSL